MFRTKHTQLALIALTLGLLTSAVTGCGDEESSEPQAKLVFAHNVGTLGKAEILINDEVVTTVMSGELSNEVSSPLGATDVAIRGEGAPMSTASDTITLAEQTYLVAFGDSSVFTVDQVPPEAEAGKHNIEVVNIRSDDLGLNVFAGQEQIATTPAAKTVTAFSSVDAANDVLISVTIASSGAPAGVQETLNLADGGATMVILGGSSADDITLNVLTVK